MDLSRKKILVTGGAGFIGSHLVKALVPQGAQVTVIDNLNDYYNPQLKQDRLDVFLKDVDFKFIKLDLTNFEKLEDLFSKNHFDIIIHLGAQAGVSYSDKNPWVYAETNTFGQINLLEMAKRYHIPKFIFASTTSVYGAKEEMPLKETDRTDKPLSLYAATKKAMELLAYTYHHSYGTQIVILRFFNVYGPWGRPDSVFVKFASSMLQNQEIEVRHKGLVKRDFTYVEDITDGIIKSISYDANGYEIFNLGSNNPQQLNYLVELFEEYLGVKAKVKYTELLPFEITNSHADISKARESFGFEPKMNFGEGVKNFVDWFLKHYYNKY